MKWFRFYSEALNDPKVQLLPAETYKGWTKLLCIVNETEPSRGPRSGFLPPLQDVAYKLHASLEETQALLDALVDAGLFDLDKGRYRAHNWHRRQPVSDDVGKRVDKARKGRTRNGNETLHARSNNRTSTAPEGEGEKRRSEGDQRERESKIAPNGASPPNSPDHGPSGFSPSPSPWGWDAIRHQYERLIGPLDAKAREQLRSFCDRNSEWTLAVINQSIGKDFGYVKRTLEDCFEKNQAPSSLKTSKARR